MNNKSLVKIVISVDPSWHGSSSESIWAEQIGCGLFEVRNSPFHAYGVSCGDVVSASLRNDGRYDFGQVERKSGHSTYRLMIFQPEHHWQRYWDQLQELGCSFEEGIFGENRILSVDVRKNANISQVYDIFVRGMNEGYWDFEEADFAHQT